MKNDSVLKLKFIGFIFLFILILLPNIPLALTGEPLGSDYDGLSDPFAIPTVTTSAATSIGGTTATLNGLVNANNENTTVSFEYSTDGNFADEETPPPLTIAATPNPVTGSGFTAISANLTGLSPGTVYYFRAVGTNASGTTYGNILLFPTAPLASVTTGIASPVTTTTATLNGTVNANNNSTTVTFEYGTTDSYGTTVTADQSPVSGTIDTAVSKAITGLTPNTTYHFRVVGVNALGTSFGEDGVFFTSAQAVPTVTTDDATYSLFPNQATLNGTVNANNADATVTFEYGTTQAYGNTVTADQSPVLGSTDTAVSKLITGLTPNTTYHYRVKATNSVGTINGSDMTFYNTTAPYARTEAASNIAQTSATLRGTVNPKTFDSGNASWTTVVTFEYGLTTGYGTTVTAIESPIGGDYNQGVSSNVTGLAPNTTYHYRVIANNENGTGTGLDMTVTTSSLPNVTTNTAAPVGTTTATLNGTVNANNDSTTVTFEYGTTDSYGSTVTADQSPVTGTADTAVSKAITGLANGTTYHYRVKATNSSGTSNGDDMTFTTGVSPPTATTNAATSVATTSAVMNGTVNANGLSTNVSFQWGLTTSYGLFTPANPNVVTGTTDTAVTLNPTILLPNTTYHYRVVAQNAGGTVYGADMSFTTNSAPTVSTDTATSVTTTGATLNGTVNAHNQSATVTFEYGTTTAYGTTVTADQSPVTGSTSTAVSKAITGLTPSTTYHYRVVAVNASGTSYGADMTFSTSVGAPIVTTGLASPLVTGAILNGIVNANNASTTVTFEYGTTVAYGQTATADQSPVTGSNNTAVTATLSGLTFNTTYHYRVVGTNINGTTNGADMTFLTGLTPSVFTNSATNVLATTATVNGTVNGNNGSWVVSFQYGTTIAYGSTMSATPSLATGATDTPVSATLTGLSPNTTYHYRTVATGGGTYYGSDMTFTTPSGPTVTTNDATSVGSNSAILHATINANNASTTVTFEYGFDTSYGLTLTADQSPVTGNTNTAVSRTLTNLIPNSTYHFRAVGSNVNGTVYGGDRSFNTTAIIPSVTTDDATGIGATGATLNGTVNPNNDSTTVTFEYGTTQAYGTVVTADQSPVTGNSNTLVSKGITGLTTNTTYHYKVVGQNGTGTADGLDKTFTTGTNTPNAVTNAASGIGATGATLNGTVNANGDSTTVTFEYGTTTGYGKTATAIQSPVTGTTDTTVSSAITGLIPATTYHYRVVAQNGFGTTNGADMTFLTPGNAPDVTTNAATFVDFASATLNGTVNAQSDTTTVTFEYGTTIAYGTTVTATPGSVTGDTDTSVTAALTGLSPGVTYHYRVVGQNTYGTSNGTDMTFTTNSSVPTVTTNAASGIGATGATLNGTVNANYDSSTVTFEYGTTIAYGTTVTASPSPVTGGTNTAVSFALTGLSQGVTYHYRVVGQNSFGTSNGLDMTFTTGTVTVPTVTTRPIVDITASSAYSGGNVTDQGLGTVTARGVCWSTSSGPTITDSFTTNGSGLGQFSSSITGLSENTTYYIRAYATNSAGTGYGQERSFNTNAETLNVTVTNPTEGEEVSGTVTIEASVISSARSGDTVQAVSKVEFYIDDVLIGTDTAEPYEKNWDTTSVTDGSHVIKVMAYNVINETSQDDITVTVLNNEAVLELNRSQMNFGAVPNGNGSPGSSFDKTPNQTLLINNIGSNTLSWTVSDDASWLEASPTSGTGSGVVSVGVDPTGLSAGTYTATLTVDGSATISDSAVVNINLVVYNSGATTIPFGMFHTPVNNSTVMSSIPVTGWVLDDIATTSVKIYRNSVSSDQLPSSSGKVYIGDADFVDGARPDIETLYPDYPLNYQAGWGYMLLTYGFPGDGTYTLYAIATDVEGNEITLGSKTITVDNANAVKPFGAIDTPEQGGIVSGSSYVNFAWALTPLPNTVPTDGSTIKVWVDGVPLSGNPVYNLFRQDIADLFPGYNNSNGAGGHMTLDTTAYVNGVHTIAWSVQDDASNIDGIGSRYFSIQNIGNSPRTQSSSGIIHNQDYIMNKMVEYMGPIFVGKGYGNNRSGQPHYTENKSSLLIIKELEPVHIQLPMNVSEAKGYLIIGNRLASLPIGSTFNHQTGTFSWIPGPGFIGTYHFTFVFKNTSGQYNKKSLGVIIEPKFNLEGQQNLDR